MILAPVVVGKNTKNVASPERPSQRQQGLSCDPSLACQQEQLLFHGVPDAILLDLLQADPGYQAEGQFGFGNQQLVAKQFAVKA